MYSLIIHEILLKVQQGPNHRVHRVAMADFWRIFHLVYCCNVRSSWGGRYAPPISSLPLCVLCGTNN
jgi:hypothetical protein